METPKNIRQIGENNTDNHIYIEDYVITYLQQIAEDMEYGSRAILLLGNTEEKGESCYYNISGAIASRKKRIDRTEFIFDEMDKEYFLEQKRLHFMGLEIVGWAVIENEFNKVYEESVWCESKDEFDGENKLFCKISGEYNEQKWYLNKNGIIKRIHGYAIFYDQNEKMQNFLILWHKEKQQSRTEEVSDQAAKRFRALVMQRNDYNSGGHVSSFFYVLCILLFMVVSVVGITTINQYDKMIAVENAMLELAQAMKENNTLESKDAVAVMQTQVQQSENQTENGNHQKIDSEEISIEEMELEENNTKEVNTEEKNTEVKNTEENSTEEVNTEENNTEESELEKDAEETKVEPVDDLQTNVQQEIYYVQEGDTLAAISYRHYHTIHKVSEICAMNQIENPDNIVVGEKILLP